MIAEMVDLNPQGDMIYDKGIVRLSGKEECELPEDLYYWIERHVWMRDEGENIITIGMTDPAQNLAGILAKVTIKPIGTKVKKGKAVAIVESGKWVGPLPSPLPGEIVERNEKVENYPGVTVINKDPYGEGWVARLKVEDFNRDKAEFKTGREGVEVYKKLIKDENIKCGEK
jgi:glycine cleavage system H protein